MKTKTLMANTKWLKPAIIALVFLSVLLGCEHDLSTDISAASNDHTAAGTGLFSVTFAQIADEKPIMSGVTIHRLTINGQTSAAFTVSNPGGYDSNSITWSICGTRVQGTSFTVHSMDAAYSSLGSHSLTVEAKKGGVPYNNTIIFTVAE